MRVFVPVVALVLGSCGGKPAPVPSSQPVTPTRQVVEEARCEEPGGEDQPDIRAHLVGEPFCRQSLPMSRACITFGDDGTVLRTYEEPDLDLSPRVFPSPPLRLRLVGFQSGCWRLDGDSVLVTFGGADAVAMRLQPSMPGPDAPPFLMLVAGKDESYVRGNLWLQVDNGIFALLGRQR
jgi:hypothetical protein